MMLTISRAERTKVVHGQPPAGIVEETPQIERYMSLIAMWNCRSDKSQDFITRCEGFGKRLVFNHVPK